MDEQVLNFLESERNRIVESIQNINQAAEAIKAEETKKINLELESINKREEALNKNKEEMEGLIQRFYAEHSETTYSEEPVDVRKMKEDISRIEEMLRNLSEQKRALTINQNTENQIEQDKEKDELVGSLNSQLAGVNDDLEKVRIAISKRNKANSTLESIDESIAKLNEEKIEIEKSIEKFMAEHANIIYTTEPVELKEMKEALSKIESLMQELMVKRGDALVDINSVDAIIREMTQKYRISIQQSREDTLYEDMTDEQLEASLKELDAEYEEEYHFRAHEENGMEGYDDDHFQEEYEKKKKAIQAELERRKQKGKQRGEQDKKAIEKYDGYQDGRGDQDSKGDDIGTDEVTAHGFWHIVNRTNTQHVGRLEHWLYQLRHLKTLSNLLPGKDGYSLGSLVGLVTSPLTLPLKGIGYLACAASGTNKKVKTVQQNVDELSTEDFMVVLNRLSSPTEAIKYKMNDIYMDAIFNRALRMFSDDKQKALPERIDVQKSIDAKLKEVAEIGKIVREGKRELTEEESKKLERLNDEIGILTGRKDSLSSRSTQISNLQVLLEEARIRKTGRYKNIGGWLFGRTNPDNLEQNAQMEEFETAELVAQKRGDYITLESTRKREEEYVKSQTKVHRLFSKIPFIKTFNISTGSYQHEEAEFVASREEDMTTRQLLALVIAGTSIVNIINSVKNHFARASEQLRIDREVNSHNAQVTQVNQDNSQFQSDINTANADISSANANNSNIQTQIDSARQKAGDIATNRGSVQQAVANQIKGEVSDKSNSLEVDIHDKGSWTNYTASQLAEDEAKHQAIDAEMASTEQQLAGANFNTTLHMWEQSAQNSAQTASRQLQSAVPYAANSANARFSYDGLITSLGYKANSDVTPIVENVIKGDELAWDVLKIPDIQIAPTISGAIKAAPTMANINLATLPSNIIRDIIIHVSNDSRAIGDNVNQQKTRNNSVDKGER